MSFYIIDEQQLGSYIFYMSDVALPYRKRSGFLHLAPAIRIDFDTEFTMDPKRIYGRLLVR
jgi:hypothetical protein